MRSRLLVVLVCLANGCAHYSHTNKPLSPTPEEGRTPLRATFDIQDPRGNEKVLVLLAISGGGSRAAYLGASVMLAMETVFPNVNILREVDVMSTVSGGSLPGAYYCISKDVRLGISVGLRGEFRFVDLPDGFVIPADLKRKVYVNPEKRLLVCTGEMLPVERDLLLKMTPPQHHEAVQQLYKLSQTPAESRRLWDAPTVKKLMTRNYIRRWAWKLLAPQSIALTACTAYDRSDVMADVLSDELFDFDIRRLGMDMGMKELNPERPYLIINATNATADTSCERTFSKVFTFTDDDFREKLASDIGSYDVGRAVMASSAFPGVFNYMTLRDFRDPAGKQFMADLQGKGSYMHVFDGGNTDNLGLESLKRVIIQNHRRYRNIVVISIDAHRAPGGVPRDEYDARKFLDYGLDRNFLDTYDCVLEIQRRRLIHEFRKRILHHGSLETPLDLRQKMFFHHVSLDNVKEERLRKKALRIGTNFKIAEEDAALIDATMPDLVCAEDSCWMVIRKITLDTADKHPSLGLIECDHGVTATE